MPVIEKGIPIPPGNDTWAPWFASLEIGDSLFVEQASAQKAKAALRGWAARNGREFTTRFAARDGMPGMRIWRTA